MRLALPCERLAIASIRTRRLAQFRDTPECLGAAKAMIAEASLMAYYESQRLKHDLLAHLAQLGLLQTAFSATTPTGRSLGQTDGLFMRAAVARRSGFGSPEPLRSIGHSGR